MLQAQGRQPHEEVRRFYARHYSSNIMKGAVMGRQSLAELEALVRAKFGAVTNADLRPAEFDGEHLKELIMCPYVELLQDAKAPTCANPLSLRLSVAQTEISF